jgi:acyl dehydratase
MANNPNLPPVTLEKLHELVGHEIGVSRWFEIDQKRIDAFADNTEDWQFIHIDPEKAAHTPFGTTIAHGFLTLSMLSAFGYDAVPRVSGIAHGVNYGFDKVRFVAPVKSGSRIRGRFKLLQIVERAPGEWQSRYGVEVEIEGSAKPALIAEWLTMFFLAKKS